MSMNALTGNIGSIATCPIRPCVHNDAPDGLVGRSARIVLVNLVAPHAGELGFGSQRIHSSRSAAFFSHRLDPSGLGFRDEALDRHLGHVSGFGYPEAYKTPFQPDRRWQGCRDLRSREAPPRLPVYAPVDHSRETRSTLLLASPRSRARRRLLGITGSGPQA